MKEFKGTKGEWEVHDNSYFLEIKLKGNFVGNIADCSSFPKVVTAAVKSEEVRNANAQLIAAAPELLQALQEVSESLNCCAAQLGIHVEGAHPKSDVDDIYGAINALVNSNKAISKALGT